MKGVLFLMLLWPFVTLGQTVKIDKITGDTSYHSGFEKLYGKPSFSGTIGEQLKVVASRDKAGYKLGLWVQTAKSLSFSVTGRLRMKLSDGAVIDIPAAGSGASEISNDLSGGSSISVFTVDQSTIDKLKTSQVIFIRLEGDDANLEYDIKEKFQKVIAECIQKIYR